MDELSQFETVCLLITSRITTVPPHCTRPEIPTLSIEAACNIFYGIYGDDRRSGVIDDLLQFASVGSWLRTASWSAIGTRIPPDRTKGVVRPRTRFMMISGGLEIGRGALTSAGTLLMMPSAIALRDSLPFSLSFRDSLAACAALLTVSCGFSCCMSGLYFCLALQS